MKPGKPVPAKQGGNTKAGNAQKKKKGGKPEKKEAPTQEDLDAALDNYMLKDANVAQRRMDADLEEYMKKNTDEDGDEIME